MTSKTGNPKRATLPRRSDYTKQFVKDWKRLTHSGRVVFVRAGTHSKLFG